MARNIYRNVAYGLSDSLLNVFQQPIVSQRDPGGNDKYQIGTLWVNTSSDDAFVLTSVVANVANWVGVAGGSGVFTSLVVNPGDLTVTAGEATVQGNITSVAGNISTTAGSIASAADVSAVGNVIASGGDVQVIAGNIDVTLGNITVSAGDITATLGDIEAAAGAVRGGQLEATDDLGGVVGVTSITNAVNTTQGAGTLSIVSASANPGNNAGFLKVYIGATTGYIPYYTDIAP
jgi:hypothetical protein